MIQLILIHDGYGLYQNDAEKRLSDEEFVALLRTLKMHFPHEFVVELYPNQDGYIFFGSSKELRRVIENFISIEKAS